MRSPSIHAAPAVVSCVEYLEDVLYCRSISRLSFIFLAGERGELKEAFFSRFYFLRGWLKWKDGLQTGGLLKGGGSGSCVSDLHIR